MFPYFDVKLFILFNITPYGTAACEVALFNDALIDAAPFHCSTIRCCYSYYCTVL